MTQLKLKLTQSACALALTCSLTIAAQARDNDGVLPNLPAVPNFITSTVPHNGDQNPYGIAYVPKGFPISDDAGPGDLLVTDFNNSNNLQGTGRTVMRIKPGGQRSIFYEGPKGKLGLSTALGVLRAGFVLVGNVPTTDGTAKTIRHGSILVLNRFGKLVAEWENPDLLNGPWDLTIADDGDHARVFVSNVLNGTVTRLDVVIPDGGLPAVQSAVIIAQGYRHRADSAALEVGPTGLAFDARTDTLYVASTADNSIYAVADAAFSDPAVKRGVMVYHDSAHLRGPLGLVLTPNGDLITANGDAINPDARYPSELVEFTPAGQFVAEHPVDLGGQGGAFGIALALRHEHVALAVVDDIRNTVKVWAFVL
ncbi:MAG TPA: hypothetical protein VGS41_02710 [Chthonomonadales bacterium]|nr:hypothetical protein [Chthonomonadales bacterium]